MKKFNTVLLGIIAVLMFAFNAQETKSQCPTGWTAVSVNMRINGCLYKLDLCAYCSLFGNIYQTQIRSITQISETPACTQTWTFQQVLNYVNSQIQTFTFFNQYLCPNHNYADCEENQVTIRTFKEPICFHVKKTMYFDVEHHVYAMCDESAYCETVKEYCIEDDGDVRVTIISGPTLMNGPIACALEGSEITVPSSFDVWSDCYIFNTLCDE